MTLAIPPAPTFGEQGFTLTEMAVVLVIVALLIGGMVVPMSAQQDIRTNTETRRLLADVSEALYGFAASHAATDGKPYLPCPDTNGDGIENRSGSACTSQDGALPWADLGLGRQDAWDNPLHYAVTPGFSDNSVGFAVMSAGSLRICAEHGCATVLAGALPAVVLSRGKNGAATPTSPDELENTDGDSDFVQKTPGNDFDDAVVWLPPPILINRMITAGRLP